MEAIILAGGKAERLGDAAGGKPKALVPVAGSPLAGIPGAALARRRRRPRDRELRRRVSVRSSSGALAGLGVDVTVVEEPEPLGRGGGLRFAASARRERGRRLRAERRRAARARPRRAPRQAPRDRRGGDHHGHAAVFALRRRRAGRRRDGHGLRGGRRVPYWVSCGVYVLGEEAVAALPERGDHETSTFPSSPARDGSPRSATTASGSPSTRRRTSAVRRSTSPPTRTGWPRDRAAPSSPGGSRSRGAGS